MRPGWFSCRFPPNDAPGFRLHPGRGEIEPIGRPGSRGASHARRAHGNGARSEPLPLSRRPASTYKTGRPSRNPQPSMRAVLSATLAKADFIARLTPILGDDLKVVDGEPAIIAAVPDADALFLTDFLYTEKRSEERR